LDFDAFELCSPELQNKLMPMREKFKEYEDTLVEESCNAKTKDKGDNAKKEMRKEIILSSEDYKKLFKIN